MAKQLDHYKKMEDNTMKSMGDVRKEMHRIENKDS